VKFLVTEFPMIRIAEKGQGGLLFENPNLEEATQRKQ
jgi:hypothetical protein